VATPERIRKVRALVSSDSGVCHSFLIVSNAAVTSKITTVRMNVARLELMEVTPIFPKIAVRAAKIAEPSAKSLQSLNGIYLLARSK